MKKYYKIIFAFLLALPFSSCESDDRELVDLEQVQAPANLGATFQITQDNSGLVEITPTGEGAALYSVDFGDGSTPSEEIKVGEAVEHIYEEGEYEVEVTGTNINGKTATGTQSLTVSFLAPENLETEIVKDADDNYTVTVSATAENAAMFEVYVGEEEDEEATPLMPGESVSYTYSSIGTFDIRVVALSGGEATTEVTEEISITDPLFLPINFESETLNYTFDNFGGGEGAGAPVIDNPDASGVNTSNRVASYTKPEGSETWAGTTIALDEPIDFSSERYVSIDVWSPEAGTDVIFKVENLENADLFVEATATTTVSEGWETLIFDMNDFDPSIEYGRIVLFFNFDVPGTGETYYFDNIETTRLELIKLPINFESENLAYEWAGFGGAGAGVIDNPDMSGLNTSAKVTELGKGEGAEGWAGVSLNLDEPLSYENGTIVKMKTWSPEAGVPILLKFEDSDSEPDANGNPSVFVEVTQNTTVAEQWEELSFDLSSFEAFDENIDYDRLIVFYDFNSPGEGTSFYFDDVRMASEDEPTSVMLPVGFENSSLTYALTPFEGADSAVEENPFQEGINISNTVVRSIKTEGAAFFAGTTLQLDGPIEFNGNNKISVKVYSPKADIPVRIKLENNDDAGIFAEVDATTTVANEWEELVFEFSEEQVAEEYSKVIMFFEFIADLPGDGSTYYYDDIQITN